MEFSGIPLPGIVSPDENIENFAKLYGTGSLGMMMLMASTLGNPYGLPERPLKACYNTDNRPSPRYGVQASHGSRVMRNGVHYNPSPAMENHRPRYSHQQEGYALPRPFQGSRSIRHEGYADHYHQRVNPQPEKQFRKPDHQNQYSFPFPERYAWL